MTNSKLYLHYQKKHQKNKITKIKTTKNKLKVNKLNWKSIIIPTNAIINSKVNSTLTILIQ